MALDLSASALVRAGSGFVFVVAGALGLWASTRGGAMRRFVVGMSIFAIGTGAFLVPRALSPDGRFSPVASALLILCPALASVGALIAFRETERGRSPVRRSTALGVGLGFAALLGLGGAFDAATIASAYGVAIHPAAGYGSFLLVLFLQALGPAFVTASAIRLASDRARDTAAQRWSAVACVVALPYYYNITLGLIPTGAWWFTAAYAFTTFPLMFAGILHLREGRRIEGLLLAWTPIALSLGLGLAREFVPNSLSFGLVSTLAAGVMGYALVTLARPAATATSRRGTLASAGLALVFIVAQVAQNFLAASYGLLLGGIIAGAFVFAASPIQRAIERSREPHARPGAAAPSERGEASYRKAVRWALRDRQVTREEEGHLLELARDLGIDGLRAHAIMVEVEREMQGRAR